MIPIYANHIVFTYNTPILCLFIFTVKPTDRLTLQLQCLCTYSKSLQASKYVLKIGYHYIFVRDRRPILSGQSSILSFQEQGYKIKRFDLISVLIFGMYFCSLVRNENVIESQQMGQYLKRHHDICLKFIYSEMATKM